MAMAECSCLMDVMDQLWFHHLVFSPEIVHPPPSTAASSPEEPLSNTSSAHTSGTQVISEDNSSIISNTQDDRCEEERDEKRAENKTSTWCQSSSPSGHRRRRRPHCLPGERRRLSKTTSCKSLCELELEEVKGFMDLGFDFEKGPLDKRMMSVIPGLQRLELNNSGKNNESNNGENEEEEGERKVSRPYLSEAWLVRGPESPLLNLTIPTASTAEDMKKNMKYWARTVASAVQLKSY